MLFFVPFRPGGTAARILWVVTVPLAIVLAVIAFHVGHRGRGGSGFRVIWLVILVAIEAYNFVTLFLGRGPQARMLQRIYDDRRRG